MHSLVLENLLVYKSHIKNKITKKPLLQGMLGLLGTSYYYVLKPWIIREHEILS